MQARNFRKTSPAKMFEVNEEQLRQELQAYLEAIQSYPDQFATTGMTFAEHLLNVIMRTEQIRGANRLKTAS